MKKRKTYLQLTVIMSVLFGIILPLALGIKDPTLIAITFSSVWFLYGVIMFIMVFLVKPGLKIKVIRHKNPTIVRFELPNSRAKEWRNLKREYQSKLFLPPEGVIS